MSDRDDIRDPRERPPDPAGTRPRHDPRSLLPADDAPLLPVEVVEGEAVEEGESPDLLPQRREPGGALGAPVAPAAHSPYASRFHFLAGALIAVALSALAALVLVIAQPRSGGVDSSWSTWRPVGDGAEAARQIASHVAPEYKLADGRQLVDVSVTPLEINGIPLAVAVREPPEAGGDIRVFEEDGVIYRLCGLGPSCAINRGKPSRERHLLLRREALELALYTFHYVGDVRQIVVFMPPRPGQQPSQALFFRRGDVARELDRPLAASLAPRVPSVRTVTLSPDATLVDQLTAPKIFTFSLTQANTDNRGFIVLDPFDATTDSAPQQDAQPAQSQGTPNGAGSGTSAPTGATGAGAGSSSPSSSSGASHSSGG